MRILKYLDRHNWIRQRNQRECARSRAIMRLYSELDRKIYKFKRLTGLNCLSGCSGYCCKSLKVETTVLELLPLAMELWRKKEAEYWLEKAKELDFSGPCVFYKVDTLSVNKGHCLVYAFRPLICRLFGFSALKNKHEKYILFTCADIKKLKQREYQKAEKKVEIGLKVPKATDFVHKLFSIDFNLGVKQYPINEALKIAIERVGINLDYQKRQKGNKDVFSPTDPQEFCSK